jgi:hypothetical protein
MVADEPSASACAGLSAAGNSSPASPQPSEKRPNQPFLLTETRPGQTARAVTVAQRCQFELGFTEVEVAEISMLAPFLEPRQCRRNRVHRAWREAFRLLQPEEIVALQTLVRGAMSPQSGYTPLWPNRRHLWKPLVLADKTSTCSARHHLKVTSEITKTSALSPTLGTPTSLRWDKRCVVAQHAWQGRRFARPLHPTRAGGLPPPCTPRRGTRPGSCDLSQPRAGWIRGQAFAPGPTTTKERDPAPSTPPNPPRIGCAATACPVASTFGAKPQNPASGFRARRHEQERGPCTPLHDPPIRRARGGDGPARDLSA